MPQKEAREMLRRVFDRPFTSFVIAVFMGWSIGVLAWGVGRSPQLAAVLPLAVALCSSRLQAFGLAFSYILAVGRGIPAFGAVWFNSEFLGWTLTLAFCLIGALVWGCLGWSGDRAPSRKALASVLAWTIALLPPAAQVLPGHVVIAWGYITPGWKWMGVGLSVVVPAGAVFYVFYKKVPLLKARIALFFLGAVLVAGSFNFQEIDSRYIGDIVAVSTKWGNLSPKSDPISRIERAGAVVRALGQEDLATVVAFPESIFGRYDDALAPVLNVELLMPARDHSMTLVFGADAPTPDGNFETAALAFYPNGETARAVARQVVPFALWRPWQKTGYFLSDWRANNILKLKDGVNARVLFCYEEYIPILSLVNEALDDHQLVLVLSNTWAEKSGVSASIQSRHSEGIAMLFGRKLIKAENRPAGQ